MREARPAPRPALAAWRAELAASRRSPWLASLVLRHASAVARRAAAIHARLAALPRRTRRRLAKQWAMALPVAALALAWSGGGAEAATIGVGDGCTLVDAIHAANGDEAVGGCSAGSGADTIVLGGGTYAYERLGGRIETEDYDIGYVALPPVRSDITIQGNGATILRDPDSEDEARLFFVEKEAALRIESAVLTGGRLREGGASSARQLGGSGGAILTLGSLHVQGSKLHANVAHYGGAVLGFSNSRTTIVDSEVLDNESSAGGGVLSTGTLSITGGRVEGNVSKGSAGGIAVVGSVFEHEAVATLDGARVIGNESGRYGGGIHNHYGELEVRDATISGNVAEDRGGGIDSYEGAMALTSSTLADNESSRGSGGGIHHTFGPLLLSDVELSGNRAGRGGGLFAIAATAEIEDSRLVDNEARDQGGGIYLDDGDLELRRSLISGNHSLGGGGGGAFLRGRGVATLVGCTVEDNVAGERGGGGIALEDIELHVVASTLRRNEAPRSGGAIESYAQVFITDTLIVSNRAETGGGVFSSYLQVHGGAFLENRAENGGGAIAGEDIAIEGARLRGNIARSGGAIAGWQLELRRATVQGNQALEDGGGVHVSGRASIVDSLLADNRAGGNGGGLRLGGARSGGEARIRNSTLSGNAAGSAGGVAWLKEGNLRLESSTLRGNAASGGAGGIHAPTGPVTITASILAESAGGDCGGEAAFQGVGNLVDDHADGACADLAEAAVTGLAPALADNGGPTLTFALLPGSNAIDALPDCALEGEAEEPLTDQRGTVRPQDGDGDGVAACDIGAYERADLGSPIFLPATMKQ